MADWTRYEQSPTDAGLVAVPAKYLPPAAGEHTVGRNARGRLETWWDIAAAHGVDVWKLIDFNFPGCRDRSKSKVVNWYLNHHKGCPLAPDGKNRAFRNGMTVYYPVPKAIVSTPVLTVGEKARIRARKIVEAFGKRSGAGVFKAFSRAELAKQLRERVDYPGKINQRASETCAMASVLYHVARDRPVEYVQLVIDLYEKGSGSIKNWKIEPGTDLKSYVPNKRLVYAADWIPLASIRDSENWFFDYEELDNHEWNKLTKILWGGGTALYEVARWLRKAGYTDVTQATGITPQDKANLEKASKMFGKGYKIIMQIDSSILYDSKWTAGKKHGRLTHAVALTSSVNIVHKKGKDYVSLNVFTWGRGKRSVPLSSKNELPLDTFLEYYYGFLAAKY